MPAHWLAWSEAVDPGGACHAQDLFVMAARRWNGQFTCVIESEKNQPPGVSRRGFIGGVTAGAATAPPGTFPVFFGRIFHLQPSAQPSRRVLEALRELGKPGGLMDAEDPLDEGPSA